MSTNMNEPGPRRHENPSDVSLSRLIKGDHGAEGQPHVDKRRGRPPNADAKDDAPWAGIEDDIVNPPPPMVFETPSMLTAAVPETIPIQPINPSSLLRPEDMIDGENAPVSCTDFDTAARYAISSLRTHIGRLTPAEARPSRAGRGGTLSPGTIEAYRKRYSWLLSRYERESGLRDRLSHIPDYDFDEIFNPVSFVNWLCSLHATLSPNSWRQYKSAVMFFIERHPHPDAPTAAAILQTVEGSSRSDGLADRGEKAVKFVRLDDYERILYFCKKRSRAAGGVNLSNFVRASIRTGMRPSEWATCDIRVTEDPEAPHGRNVWLFVCNAKASNGRANGPVRVLDLSAISDGYLKPIWETMWLFRRQAPVEGADRVIRRIRQMLMHVAKKLKFKDVYSPYSFRHQAIANWKTIYSPIEVAALAGHSIPDTATTHYGKGRDAWSGGRFGNLVIKPSDLDVQRIAGRVRNASPEMLMRPDGSRAFDQSPGQADPSPTA